MNVGAAQVLTYAAAPAAASALGGMLALLRPPGPRAAAAAQLFTAGVIFAAVAGELLPELTQTPGPWSPLGSPSGRSRCSRCGS